ncbi:hypothetical protein PV396_44000 [Streptomyces sp. ME02-8801-2C]|uniref:hypothetical protein n=1 Tax=Streptomyces sp. ME02-8801-2C TaxID=3028680 RepID=UPI0029BD8618|nr:hypothetical protein [Streptomyces sp. ME02-8801-2C]MDX3458809.1 hypothetical protein [Streptomyces sp. ME02-8801-2C]
MNQPPTPDHGTPGLSSGTDTLQEHEALLAAAAHHRSAMVGRRTIGLQLVAAAATFDFIATKLVQDSVGHVSHVHQLAWVLRLVVVGAFVALVGMLVQVESRNRNDRLTYLWLEDQARALREGQTASSVPKVEESLWQTCSRSWASTWPLGAIGGLTIALFWFAGLLR